MVNPLNVSPFVLGTAQVGLDYGVANQGGKPDRRRAEQILLTAYERGVRRFETAPSYGDSEQRLGEFLGSAGKSDVEFMTKLSGLRERRIDSGRLRDVVLRDVESSLNNLQTDTLAGLLLHDVSDLFHYEKTLVEGLEELRERGLVRQLGVSVYKPEELRRSLSYFDFEIAEFPVNLLDRRFLRDSMVSFYEEHGLETYARSVYLQGLFFLPNGDLPANLKQAREPVSEIRDIASTNGVRIQELALGFVRAQACVDNVVVGAENPGQLRENLEIFGGKPSPALDILPLDRLRVDDESVLLPYMWENQS